MLGRRWLGLRFSGVIKVPFQNDAVFCVGGIMLFSFLYRKKAKNFLDFRILEKSNRPVFPS